MKYYLYRHIREDKNEPFYIGIGSKGKQDIMYHTYSRAIALHKDNSIWLRIVAKTNWHYEILFESDNRELVLNKEREFIQLYGRICNKTGSLANLTLGGEQNDGYIFTPEQRKKISDSQKGKPGRRTGTTLTEQQLEKRSVISTEVANRPEMIEYRRKLATGNKYHLGHQHSEESKNRMRISAKNRGLNCITVPCVLEDTISGLSWSAESIAALARICPLSLSTLNRLSQGITVSTKTNNRYKFTKNVQQNTVQKQKGSN